MNRVKTRTVTALILAGMMVCGLFYYIFCYITDGAVWASFKANRNVYTSSLVLSGTVTDRNGVVLTSGDGETRWYNEDKSTRLATLHVLGDRSGNIGTSVLNRYSSYLFGYDPISGTYSLSDRGNTIQLSIDAGVNRIALEAMGGAKGTVLVYNYKTGEILCMVSSPTFDPDNQPDFDAEGEKYEGVYLNRGISATFTPGSVFKLVTAAAAIENITDIFDREFHCSGTMEVGGGVVNCHSVHGTLGIGKALAVSCNCAFAEIALLLEPETLARYAAAYSLTAPLSLDVISTAAGTVEQHSGSWQLAWSGIGQSTNLVNPMSFLQLMGAFANEGYAVTPRFVLSYRTPLGITLPLTKQQGTQLVKKDTANVMKELMANNVASNYGAANYPGLDLCAKSGTAEVGGDLQPHAWFAGFLRNEEAPLAFVVVMENSGSGSQVAGAVANKVLQAALKSLTE